MKKYFAKYLPTIDNSESKLYICTKDIQAGDEYCIFDVSGNMSIYECIKREGDGVYYGQITSDDVNGCVKIIGPVSKGAIWVKEGDEFDDNEISSIYAYPVRKTFRNGEKEHNILSSEDLTPADIEDLATEWAERDSSGRVFGYTVYWDEKPRFLFHVKIQCSNCKIFH